jgi:hypothetical protein
MPSPPQPHAARHAAGSAPSSQNWFYDIGTGYGTGEIGSAAPGRNQARST